MHFAAVGAHHKAAFLVHIDGLPGALPALRQVKGDPAAQIDAGGLVLLPEGRKAVPGKGVQVAVKAKVGQALGQPGRVGGKINVCPLQCQRGAVGQVGSVKIALGLGQIDADAAQDAAPLLLVTVAHAFAQDAHDFFAVEQQVVGILCEGVSYGYQQQGRGILCGIGINLAQPQSYFDAADLPHGTSLALQGAAVDLATDPAWLAEGLTDFGFDRNLYTFARDGFAPFREEYKAACVNLGRRVTFDLPDGSQGAGEAVDVDAEGRLVVRTDAGEQHVFTGEVSVHGIYGAV